MGILGLGHAPLGACTWYSPCLNNCPFECAPQPCCRTERSRLTARLTVGLRRPTYSGPQEAYRYNEGSDVLGCAILEGLRRDETQAAGVANSTIYVQVSNSSIDRTLSLRPQRKSTSRASAIHIPRHSKALQGIARHCKALQGIARQA